MNEHTRRLLRRVMVAGAAAAVSAVLLTPAPAHGDTVAYLVNVTVRPGYNFTDSAAALGYGYRVCDKVRRGDGYPDVVVDVKTDFNTTDEFQASYLITQAVNELCPGQIWRLRNSAARYRPANQD